MSEDYERHSAERSHEDSLDKLAKRSENCGAVYPAAVEYVQNPMGMLTNSNIGGRGNSAARNSAVLSMQRTHGNQAVQRFVQRTTAEISSLEPTGDEEYKVTLSEDSRSEGHSDKGSSSLPVQRLWAGAGRTGARSAGRMAGRMGGIPPEELMRLRRPMPGGGGGRPPTLPPRIPSIPDFGDNGRPQIVPWVQDRDNGGGGGGGGYPHMMSTPSVSYMPYVRDDEEEESSDEETPMEELSAEGGGIEAMLARFMALGEEHAGSIKNGVNIAADISTVGSGAEPLLSGGKKALFGQGAELGSGTKKALGLGGSKPAGVMGAALSLAQLYNDPSLSNAINAGANVAGAIPAVGGRLIPAYNAASAATTVGNMAVSAYNWMNNLEGEQAVRPLSSPADRMASGMTSFVDAAGRGAQSMEEDGVMPWMGMQKLRRTKQLR